MTGPKQTLYEKGHKQKSLGITGLIINSVLYFKLLLSDKSGRGKSYLFNIKLKNSKYKYVKVYLNIVLE